MTRSNKFACLVLACVMSLWLGVASAKTVVTEQWQAPITNESVTTTLDHYKGQVIWLDFWASWCGPCRASFPWLNKMQQRYGKKGLKVIAVNVDENREDAKKFLRQIPASFQVSFDPEGTAPALFDIQGMPTSVLIDRQGEIHLFHVGFHKNQEAELEDLIKKTLKL